MHSVLFLTPVWLIFSLFEWVNHLFDWFALWLAAFAGNLLPHLNDTVYKTQNDSQSALQQLFLQNCAPKWGRGEVAELVINSSTTFGQWGQFWSNGFKSADLRRNTIWPRHHCHSLRQHLNFFVTKQMGEKRNKRKRKISEPKGEIFHDLFKKLQYLADRPACSVAYKVLHIFKSAGFSQKYRNGLRSLKATAYRDYFQQGFVARLCLDRSATMRQ